MNITITIEHIAEEEEYLSSFIKTKHEFISAKCENDNHYLWVHLKKFSLDIGVIYKPEKTNTANFLETFSEELQKRKRTILFGDFNFNLLNKDHNTSAYKETLLENCYSILNKIDAKYCTREKPTTKTILDHVVTGLKEHNFHLTIIDSIPQCNINLNQQKDTIQSCKL